MFSRYSLKTAAGGLRMHKSRSFLTILGIVIGIAAIILVVSLGQGAQNLILGQIKSIGPKTIAIIPGRQPKGPTDIAASLTDSLKQRDASALLNKNNVPHLASLMPVIFGSTAAAYGSNTYRPTIFGVTGLFADIYNLYPAEGRIFDDQDIQGYANVVVLGSKVKDELFGNDEALNQKIKLNGRNFAVIGILPKKGQSAFVDFDEVAIVPYTTAQEYIFGIKYFNRLIAEADSEANVAQTVADIKTTLRNLHGIADPSKDDFFVETQESALQIVGTITNVLTLFLAAIAAISLVVGGIGIMNIMLVSVTERTKEIGLRKAVGATDGNILSQFLLEATILTALGGALGIAAGAAFSFLVALILTEYAGVAWIFSFPVGAAFLGLGVAAGVGIVFGIYPAWKASQLSPTEALRYE